MRKINYKSDFDFILRLRDCRGEEIGWPQFDWTATFWTASRANSFTAGCTGGEARNCYNDGGQIHVVANGHGLWPGQLKVELTAELPNGAYADGSERLVAPMELDIELIAAAAPCPEQTEAELMLPCLKGEAFSYADFTEAQLDDLAARVPIAAASPAEIAEILNETINQQYTE